MKKTIISRFGGDRATAYAMSNKIVSLPDGYLCTWIDSRRLNRWALVDRADGAVLREGALGEPCLDNHCGAALAVADGAVHAITGGHHSALRHYRMDLPAADGWREVAVIEAQGTYPSLVADAGGAVASDVSFFRRAVDVGLPPLRAWRVAGARVDRGGDARWRIHLQSSLTADRAGRLHAALMLQPAGSGAWGERGTHLVRVVIEPDDATPTSMSAEALAAPDEACAQWLPAWEHAGGGRYPEAPALLFTRGENAGGYAQNENDVEAEVWFCR